MRLLPNLIQYLKLISAAKTSCIILILLSFYCLEARAASHTSEFLIVPGISIGLANTDVSESALKKAFGFPAVTIGLVTDPNGAEGDTIPGLILFKDTHSELKLTYSEGKLVHVATTWDDSTARWTLPNGIRSGTTFAELERLNQRPFELFFSRIDVPSHVLDWKGGKLAEDPNMSKVDLIVQEPAGVEERYEVNAERLNLREGIRLMSNDPVLKSDAARVDHLEIDW